MKIEDNREKSLLIPLSDLEQGKVFETHNGIFIKTEEYRCGVFTCTALLSGKICTFSREYQVTPLKAKVVIE